jgi:hypothetical protein
MTKEEAANRRIVVDEYADLVAETTPWKAKFTRRDDLAKIIRDWYVAEDANATHTAQGERFHVLLSPKGNETVINMRNVWNALGRKQFIEAVSVSLTRLKELLPAATVASFTTKEQTGSRTLTVQAAPKSAAA